MKKVKLLSSPTAAHANDLAGSFPLESQGLRNLGRVYWNLPEPALYEESIFRGESRISTAGPLVVRTGAHTARAAADKAVVRELSSEAKIWWGEYNRPYNPEKFAGLFARVQAYLQGEDVFVQDMLAGADPEYQMPIRVVTELAWQSLFARCMFIPHKNLDALKKHVPEFTLIAVPSFRADPRLDGTNSETFIIINFADRLALIGGTGYGGEIKKAVFTVMNYLLPAREVLPMHCSANVGRDNDAALFFGLSGTGKTTLSADPNRRLVGDDEHGWSDNGVFNFEGGCYAKVIRLSPEHEPEIHACTRRFGTVIENVVYDEATRNLDLDDDQITENTRAAYPLDFINNSVPEKMVASHPKNIILLTCDATGVLPPISRLSPEQTMYHFISGYTSKIAGTEVGLGIEPELTFSACFGAPFMVHHPNTYANMLRSKMIRYGARCWLVNTGWTGGSFGIGKRISIRHTRALLNAALDGALNNVEFGIDPVFGFEVPRSCPGVPHEILDPARAWGNRDEYFKKYDALAARFIDNFALFASGCAPEVTAAGPKRLGQPTL
ncbi:MAG: phosphoenolpyruvate carboxykinase (ATP) [Deltaproteobacteria bacterium RIFOXYA12_FULL_58_15]|nr:MAG: phosphoenolpyruvate carboxykinase (ATP) [Deltaproteobacteria bacterium RIFOXYA12_FULL_58_15]OGR15076.1 MAG: phosphoenolpyruvate carboxykinase (ATP) [Deltaproteobacteria bacterium RIFOXYB12_FULL_58_9]